MILLVQAAASVPCEALRGYSRVSLLLLFWRDNMSPRMFASRYFLGLLWLFF
jgi:hypothetical protein